MGPFALAVLLVAPIQAETAAPDRSGEGELKKIMTWAKSLDNVHIMIGRSSRGNALQPLYPDSRIDLWISGAKFRVETSNMWDGGSSLTCDGASVLNDPNNEYVPASITTAQKDLLGTLSDVGFAPEDASPFFTLMNGPDKLEKLVEKTAAVRIQTISGERAIVFDSKKLGAVKVFFRDDKAGMTVSRIDFDNRPAAEEQFKKYPEWADPPEDGALSRHEIRITAQRPSASFFSTQPPKGRQFEDKRAKKG